MFGYYADLEEVLEAALEAADSEQNLEGSTETPSDIVLV